MRDITVSFGKGDKAVITAVKTLPWEQFAAALTAEPPEGTDKAARGWYIPATFDPVYRDSDNFVGRDAITFDFDHVNIDTWGNVINALKNYAFAMYTTYSHIDTAPRFRVVLPLGRLTTYDEFQAVSRRLAGVIGIELIARESFVPAQMMYLPTRKLGGGHASHINKGAAVDVDAELRTYNDWTDRTSWPRRADGDAVHSLSEGITPPDEKPGIVGDFCRKYRVAEAIAAFDLPYKPSDNSARWTYALGSVPEGAIEYDDGLKFHSHHDTDPARGQNNTFDLVRLHRFGKLDAGVAAGTSVTDLPSYRAMCDLVRAEPWYGPQASTEFADYSSEVAVDVISSTVERFLVRSADEFSAGPAVDWIIRGVLPRAELAVIYGQSGSGKSFLALDLCASISRGVRWRDKRTAPGRVVYVCAEGAGGFKARINAYARGHDVPLACLPAIIADAPNLLDPKDAAAITHAVVAWGGADVIVIDTLSAVAPGGDENSGEDMGLVVSHCKLLHRKTGALVVLIHHSGKDESKGARGWSGLRAAADAEIEVTRNGDYRAAAITKMKDSGDSEQWAFKLKVIDLGTNTHGETESSCVIEHVDSATVATPKKQLVGLPRTIHDTLAMMAPSGTCHIDDLIEGVKMKMPKPEGRDTRKQIIVAALNRTLIPPGHVYMHGEDRISLTNILTHGDPDDYLSV